MNFRSYIKALRLPFLAGSLIPVLIGGAYGILQKRFSMPPFLLCLAGVACLHLGANLINDYYDARGSDPMNVQLTPFSGGSRVIPEGEVAAPVVLAMSLFFFALGLACGLWFAFHGRVLVLAIGIAGLFAGWSYSSPPLQLMSKGLGEIIIFIAFGPLITLGTYYALAGELSFKAFLLGIPQGFLIMGVIWINQFPDYEADRMAGKRNLAVRLGLNRARTLYCIIMALSFLSIIILVGAAGFSYLLMIGFISLPLGFRAVKILWKEYESHERIVPAQALTIQTLVGQGLLISLGLLLSRFIAP